MAEPAEQPPLSAKMQALNARFARMKNLSSTMSTITALKAVKNDVIPAEVSPRLFIGAIGTALKRDILLKHNITHIVCCVNKVEPVFPETFEYYTVPLPDTPDSDIRPYFEDAHAFMDSCLAGSGAVFVHCFAGISRSSTIMMSYLMSRQSLNVLQAFQMVRAARNKVMPNAGFRNQLKLYETELGIEGATLEEEEDYFNSLAQSDGAKNEVGQLEDQLQHEIQNEIRKAQFKTGNKPLSPMTVRQHAPQFTFGDFNEGRVNENAAPVRLGSSPQVTKKQLKHVTLPSQHPQLAQYSEGPPSLPQAATDGSTSVQPVEEPIQEVEEEQEPLSSVGV